MLKRYRYRAYPKPGQVEPIARLFGCVRVTYNDALAHALEIYRLTGTKPSAAELSARLTALKKTEERFWLSEVSSVPLQQALRDLDKAYKAFLLLSLASAKVNAALMHRALKSAVTASQQGLRRTPGL